MVIDISCLKLAKKDWFGKSDPFVEVTRQMPNGASELIYKTEVVKSNLDPVFRTFSMNTKQLCGGNLDAPLKFSVSDWDSNTSSEPIGNVTMTVNEMLQSSSSGQPVPLKHYSGKAKDVGAIRFRIVANERPSLFAYLAGGMEINLSLAIDFTGSNGDPRNPTSLHFIRPDGMPNEYQAALTTVTEILQNFDKDKMFPTFGFGGQFKGRTNHCFPLNGIESNPYCAGIPGILSAYHAAIQNVPLSGPTNFTPIVSATASVANGFHAEMLRTGRQQYAVLLILTDGEVTDFSETKRAIAAAAALPMSIVIVGVGKADFGMMKELDGDDAPASASKKRDIVQFVPFRDCQGNPNVLAREVLAEIPDQVISYMQMYRKLPNAPIPPPPAGVITPQPGAAPAPAPAPAAAAVPTPASAHAAPPGPPPPSAPPPLKAGWEVRTDPASGRPCVVPCPLVPHNLPHDTQQILCRDCDRQEPVDSPVMCLHI
jgi:hypothetical protein